jgi:hypothetical protein
MLCTVPINRHIGQQNRIEVYLAKRIAKGIPCSAQRRAHAHLNAEEFQTTAVRPRRARRTKHRHKAYGDTQMEQSWQQRQARLFAKTRTVMPAKPAGSR